MMEQASQSLISQTNSVDPKLTKALNHERPHNSSSPANNDAQVVGPISDKTAKSNLKAVEKQRNDKMDMSSEQLSCKDSQVSQVDSDMLNVTLDSNDDDKDDQTDDLSLPRLNPNQDEFDTASHRSQQTHTTTGAVDGLEEDLPGSWRHKVHWPSVTAGLLATLWPPLFALLYEEVLFPHHPQDDWRHDAGIVGFVAIGAVLGMCGLCCTGNRDAKKSIGMILIPSVMAAMVELGFYRGYSGKIDHRAAALRKRDRIIFYSVVGLFSSIASLVDTKCCTAEYHRKQQEKAKIRLENRVMRNKVRSKKTKEQFGEMSLLIEELRSPNGVSNGAKPNSPLKSSAPYQNHTKCNRSRISYNSTNSYENNMVLNIDDRIHYPDNSETGDDKKTSLKGKENRMEQLSRTPTPDLANAGLNPTGHQGSYPNDPTSHKAALNQPKSLESASRWNPKTWLQNVVNFIRWLFPKGGADIDRKFMVKPKISPATEMVIMEQCGADYANTIIHELLKRGIAKDQTDAQKMVGYWIFSVDKYISQGKSLEYAMEAVKAHLTKIKQDTQWKIQQEKTKQRNLDKEKELKLKALDNEKTIKIKQAQAQAQAQIKINQDKLTSQERQKQLDLDAIKAKNEQIQLQIQLEELKQKNRHNNENGISLQPIRGVNNNMDKQPDPSDNIG